MAKLKLPVGNIFMIVVVAMVAIYLFDVFSNRDLLCTQAMIDNSNEHGCKLLTDTYTEFVIPAQAEMESAALWVIRFLILGVAIFIGYQVVSKLTGQRIGRKDVMTLVMLGVAVYLIWDYVLVPSGILNVDSIRDISWFAAKNFGVIP